MSLEPGGRCGEGACSHGQSWPVTKWSSWSHPAEVPGRAGSWASRQALAGQSSAKASTGRGGMTELCLVKKGSPSPTPWLHFFKLPTAFRTEPLKDLLRADQDLLTSLNPLVKSSLLKSEADSLSLFCFASYCIYFLSPLAFN